jgi:hypothetical protein
LLQTGSVYPRGSSSIERTYSMGMRFSKNLRAWLAIWIWSSERFTSMAWLLKGLSALRRRHGRGGPAGDGEEKEQKGKHHQEGEDDGEKGLVLGQNASLLLLHVGKLVLDGSRSGIEAGVGDAGRELEDHRLLQGHGLEKGEFVGKHPGSLEFHFFPGFGNQLVFLVAVYLPALALVVGETGGVEGYGDGGHEPVYVGVEVLHLPHVAVGAVAPRQEVGVLLEDVTVFVEPCGLVGDRVRYMRVTYLVDLDARLLVDGEGLLLLPSLGHHAGERGRQEKSQDDRRHRHHQQGFSLYHIGITPFSQLFSMSMRMKSPSSMAFCNSAKA